MSSRLITLERWAASTYGEDAPHINTLRRWARDGMIVPTPEKHGRTYFVRPDACYLDHHTPSPAMHCAPRAARLADRIAG